MTTVTAILQSIILVALIASNYYQRRINTLQNQSIQILRTIVKNHLNQHYVKESLKNG